MKKIEYAVNYLENRLIKVQGADPSYLVMNLKNLSKLSEFQNGYLQAILDLGRLLNEAK
jgi:hypothetical protein